MRRSWRAVHRAVYLYRQNLRWEKARHPLKTLELGDYSRDECLMAADRCSKVERQQIGEIAGLLWNRCGRGKVTIEGALALYDNGLREMD